MGISTKENNLFRYIHLKPARLTEKLKEKIKTESTRPERANAGTKSPSDCNKTSKSHRDTLLEALNNLETLDLTHDVNLSNAGRAGSPNKFLTLNSNGIAKLSGQTSSALKTLNLDPLTVPHNVLMDGLNAALEKSEDNETRFNLAAQQPNGKIQSVGVANLLVVKQQIKKYEAAEIAHIENLLAGENKVRTHDELTRIEEFSSSSSEKTTDTETELTTTERFELNKQTSNTFQKDTELGLELTVSGKYGPSISFESNLNAGQNTSESKSKEQSVDFAKDTVDRSKERIVEKIAVEQKRTLIREIKETNEHTLKNETNDHRFAIYQYVDQILESQVFDYGKRLMFDFMIPEPSSFLWYMKKNTTLQIDLQEPKKLEDSGIFDSRGISKSNYIKLGAMYGTNDLPTPPEIYVTKRVRLAHGTGETSDDGKHKSGVSGEVEIPKGYGPNVANLTILATSDEDLFFSINLGGIIFNYSKDDFGPAIDNKGGHKKYSLINKKVSIGDTEEANHLAPAEKLFIDIYGYESANYSVQMEILFYALYDPSALEYPIISSWKQDVYEKLAEAYQNSFREYQQELSFLTAEADARDRDKVDFGSPPAVNKKLILTELKKHCLAIIRNEHAGALVTEHSGEPPQFDIADAKEDGEVIRFLEHAFEWGQIQYVFYPYFWARPESDMNGWIDRFLSKHRDYTMDEFLKAGYARVVVPVREGFDSAVSFFIEKGEVFNGLGEPNIDDPLYLSIIDEIKERTDAGKGEIPVGGPWDTRLPTAAVIVRKTDTLPSWIKQAGEDWAWEPAPIEEEV